MLTLLVITVIPVTYLVDPKVTPIITYCGTMIPLTYLPVKLAALIIVGINIIKIVTKYIQYLLKTIAATIVVQLFS